MTETKATETVPILALPRPLVLLPGARVRLSLRNRPDIVAILAAGYKSRIASVVVGCVPLINSQEHLTTSSARTSISQYGTLAQVVSVQGRGRRDQTITLKGLSRFRLENLVQQRPYATARITRLEQTVDQASSREMQHELHSLRLWAKEFATITYLAAAVAQQNGLKASHTIAKAVGQHPGDPGLMADTLLDVITCTFEDRLSILRTVDKHLRLSRLIEIMERQIADLPPFDHTNLQSRDEKLSSLLIGQSLDQVECISEDTIDMILCSDRDITCKVEGGEAARDISIRSKL